jgi:hypothetical protein
MRKMELPRRAREKAPGIYRKGDCMSTTPAQQPGSKVSTFLAILELSLSSAAGILTGGASVDVKVVATLLQIALHAHSVLQAEIGQPISFDEIPQQSQV